MAAYPAIRTDGQRVLVTGANGFIGSRLCNSLIENGFTVIAGVRKSANLDFLAGLELEYNFGDVTKPDTLAELIQDADIVIHNAGLVKAKNKSRLFEVNIHGSEALIKACVNSASVKRFIFVSSLAAYGPAKSGLRREEDTPEPITTYGRSKLEAEKLLLPYADKINLQFARPVGVYGPGDTEIFTFFQSVARGFRPAIGDTNRKIQLIYVEDLVQGLTKMLQHDLPSGLGYFLAEQNASTFAELTEQMALACDRKTITLPIPGWLFKIVGALAEIACVVTPFTPILTAEKAQEILSPWEISIERAQNHFDFSPRTDFAEGSKKTVRWYREHGWL